MARSGEVPALLLYVADKAYPKTGLCTVPITEYFNAYEAVSELDATEWYGYLEPVDQHTVRVKDLDTLRTMILLNRS